MTKEIWRQVLGYEGYYEISNLGRLKALRRKVRHRSAKSGWCIRKERIKSSRPMCDGRYFFTLFKEGIAITKGRSVLICEAFVSPNPGELWVLHKNGDSTDDRPENLYWGTPKDNANDRGRHGRTTHGEAHWCSILKEEDVKEIRRLRGKVRQKDLAKRFGVTQPAVSFIQLGKGWKHVGAASA